MAADSGWEYRNPTRVVVGPGASSRLGDGSYGRALLVTSPGATRRGLTQRVSRLLDTGGVVVHDRVEPNPTVERLDGSIEALRGVPIETIVAVGGGSVIDTAKVLALAHAIPGAGVRDLVAGKAPADVTPVPLIAVPTTAGTGSEVTPFATVWDAGDARKLSVADPRLFPATALVDAMLTLELGWEQTVSSGLDAYVQCLEAICNRNANAVTSAFAERGLATIPGALRRLRREPGALEARALMAEAALLSGLAISHTRTALAHSMSYPITAHYGVPHGLACALVLPAVLEFNIDADDGRLASAARGVGLDDAEQLLEEVVALFRELGVAELAAPYMPGIDSLGPLAGEMLTPARSDNNLRLAVEADVRAILGRTQELIGARRP
jgi:alcohol dehydrogenase